MVTTQPGGSSDHQDGGITGEVEEEEDEIPVGNKEVDVIGMERKQIIVVRTSFRSRLTFK
eukprot:CAMPEP_0170791920 /NCGR_PEP_ID=MMETSP0733-20121128/21479_1 /TAXON_ID=186038 /ORGANISM="Fragilariopsis kerguelensis, Strain L26-C5" /LENGTH=59 /DNA_ID=CAMNT_0011140037 /DNA_START=467 /DNA_END=646 /DNA_ORIENTATION=+